MYVSQGFCDIETGLVYNRPHCPLLNSVPTQDLRFDGKFFRPNQNFSRCSLLRLADFLGSYPSGNCNYSALQNFCWIPKDRSPVYVF